MAKANVKEYRISWEDYQGRACMLRIVDTEEKSSTRVETLVAGMNPFVSHVSDDDDPMVPARAGHATISVVNNYTALGLIEMSSSRRYRVILERTETSVTEVVWLGWIKAESLTQDYESSNGEFELDCIDDVEALGCWDMLHNDDTIGGYAFGGGFENVHLSTILAECFAHVNNAAGEGSLVFHFPIEGDYTMWQLWYSVSRGLFFETKDIDSEDDDKSKSFYEAKTCREAVEEICKAYGWTVQQSGKNIVFSTPMQTGKYAVVNMQELYDAELNGAQEDVDTVTGLAPMGSHDIAMYPGVHKVSVKASLTKSEELLPDVEDGIKFLWDAGEWSDPQDENTKVRKLVYESKDGRVLETYGYKMDNKIARPATVDDINYSEFDWPKSMWAIHYANTPERQIFPDHTETWLNDGFGICGFGKADKYRTTDNKKNYEFKTGVCFNICYPFSQWGSDNNRQVFSGDLAFRSNKPLLTMRGGIVTFLDGCLSFQASIYSMESGNETWMIRTLPVSIKVGNRYYRPDKDDRGENIPGQGSWVAQKCVFDLPLNDSLGGAVDDTKTLAMPYDGAVGYIMPISEYLSGNVEVSIYMPELHSVEYWRRFLVHNISLKHYNEITNIAKKLPNHYNYTKMHDEWADDKVNVEVKLHSSRDKQASAGQIFVPEVYGGYSALEFVPGMTIRPEQLLLNKLESYYGRARKTINLTVKGMDWSLLGTYNDGKGGKWRMLGATSTDWKTGVCRVMMVDY